MADPNWVNRTVWTGDNLDIMRGMNSESVDLIYLDPPFNSNRNYAAPVGSKAAGAAFKDTWALSDLDVAWMGLIADTEPALYQVVHAAGLAHGKGMQSYLCMMAVRLIEMRRLLKPTGSIYLHCDPTASHYLKALMDVVFGRQQFRNEITWQRTNSHNNARKYGNITDTILYYAKSDTPLWHTQLGEYGESQLNRYRHDDGDGRKYRLDDLTAPAGGGGATITVSNGEGQRPGLLVSGVTGWINLRSGGKAAVFGRNGTAHPAWTD